ncbi:MAG: hypothetical protein ROZ09_11560 [Thiobacillus sp.]|uniref:hypothetical protein n=1 Tax=Thiobacillus sp. TaxID=924 RepID=UPI002895C7F1|nr:hypothetical protein [Thiobacillus sp.]MDT3707456.1 hypothetical protein [Thiobacillus sp.]
MSPNEEILQVIRYAPGPIGAAGIYEQCKGIENINDVSSRLSQLFAQGKVDRVEITTANNRKGYAYLLPRKGAGEAAPAAAAPGAVIETPTTGEAPAPAEAAAAPAAAQPKPERKKPGRKPKADPVAKALDQVEAALKDSPAPNPAAKASPRCDQVAHLLPTDAEKLANAIIAKTSKQLAPLSFERSDAANPIVINIHIEQLDIHMGAL